jgi:hypothetical protein
MIYEKRPRRLPLNGSISIRSNLGLDEVDYVSIQLVHVILKMGDPQCAMMNSNIQIGLTMNHQPY